MMAVNTKTVQNRRELHYESFADVLNDANALAKSGYKTVGNWSYGQILNHLATAMSATIDGFESRAAWPMRAMANLLFKKRFLTKTLPAGFQIPTKWKKLIPHEVSVEEGLENLRTAIGRLQTETARASHPFLDLTAEQSDLMQLRHAELHMSFVVPDNEQTTEGA